MDANVARIADYVSRVRYEDLPPDVVHDAKRRIIDTLGCGLGAFDAEPCRIARKIASRSEVSGGAHLLGTRQRVLLELGAFANGVMMRYLDGNDSYPGGGGHASDTIAAILAAASSTGASGRQVITAVAAAYDVFYNLYTAAKMRDQGWDHVFYIAVASAAGAASIFGLDRERTAHAIALAITPNLALEVTRRGHLSMWKGSAGGNAARNGAFAALLAAEGMTGPDKPIEGTHGLWHMVGQFQIADFPGGDRPYRIKQANLKFFLSEYHSQSPIEAAMKLHGQVAPEDIEAVTVHTYKFAQQEIADGREKWRPTTRESADHSLPYIVAAVLTDGRFSDEIFAPARIADPALHALMDKIAVEEDPELTRQFPAKVPCRIEVTTRRGERKSAVIEFPRGHHRNPMSDAEVEAKFGELAERFLPTARARALLQLLWELDRQSSLDPVYEAARIEYA
jgi:2-methylcitrate dehydratase